MYLECTGQGSPTVVLISGGGIAADLWDSPLGEQPTVYPTIAKTTRVCAYDRPGTTRARAEGGFSRSDPVAQPVTPSRSVDDLHALLTRPARPVRSCSPPTPTAAWSPACTPTSSPPRWPGCCSSTASLPSSARRCRKQWPTWIEWNTTRPEIIEDYPDYERVDFDEALDEIAANRTSPPMPLVVLTADHPYPAPTKPGIPANINTVTREAQDVSQPQVALLAPGAEHITQTNSRHDIMLENPVLVSDAILEVIASVRDTAPHQLTAAVHARRTALAAIDTGCDLRTSTCRQGAQVMNRRNPDVLSESHRMRATRSVAFTCRWLPSLRWCWSPEAVTMTATDH